MVNPHPAPKDRPLPVRQLVDDWEALNGEWSPHGQPDCEQLWLALGSTIQTARTTAGEMQKGPGQDTDTEFVVDDWEMFLERAWDNIHVGLETMKDRGCITPKGAKEIADSLPSAFEEVKSTRHAHALFSGVETGYKQWAPTHLLDADYDPGRDYDYDYPATEGGGATGGGGGYRMRCAEGDSLGDVERRMNDKLADSDERPESLSVDRDEELDVYYACTLVKKVATDVED